MRRQNAAMDAHIKSAARWFWWIAGLSLVNVAMFHANAGINFLVGLGITALSDAVFANIKLVGLFIDALVIGFFFYVGLQAQRGKLWSFYVGSAVYALDALIFVAVQQWLSVAFHGLALFFIIRGAKYLREELQEPNIGGGTAASYRVASSHWRR